MVKDLGPFWDATNLVARSITGELTWKARTGCVLIDTARTQAVIGFLSAEPHALGAVSLNSPTRFGAVYVTAMDDREPIRRRGGCSSPRSDPRGTRAWSMRRPTGRHAAPGRSGT